MFYSETYKTHWWGPPRIASRALMAIPRTLNFTDNQDGHSLTVINPEWDVVLPIRNPYSRTVSWWNLRQNEKNGGNTQPRIPFEEFIKQDTNEYFSLQPGSNWEPISKLSNQNLKAKYLLRYENLVEDLMKIDFVYENFQILKDELYLLKYHTRNSYRREYIDNTLTPICSFYTQELADIVWENKKFEFLEWGYERDSWKYLL